MTLAVERGIRVARVRERDRGGREREGGRRERRERKRKRGREIEWRG